MTEYRSTLLEVNDNFASTEMQILKDEASEGPEVIYVNILNAEGDLVGTVELPVQDTSLDFQFAGYTLAATPDPLVVYSATIVGVGYRTGIYVNTGDFPVMSESLFPVSAQAQFGSNIIGMSDSGNTIVIQTAGGWDTPFAANILTRDAEGMYSVIIPMSAALGYNGNAKANPTSDGDYIIFNGSGTYLGLYKLENGTYVRKTYAQFTSDFLTFYGVQISPDKRRFFVGADSNYSLYGGYINGDVLTPGSTRVALPDWNQSNSSKVYIWLSESRFVVYRAKTNTEELTNIHIYDISATGIITFVQTIVKNKRYMLYPERKINSPTAGRYRMMAYINGIGGIVEIDISTGDIVAEMVLPEFNEVTFSTGGFFSPDGTILNVCNLDNYPARFSVAPDLTVTKIS